MLESVPVAVLVGTLLGFLSGLGIGGGSLLMVWLTAVLGWGIQDARAINLLFFLPSAVISCIIRYRQENLRLKAVIPAIISGSILAVGGSMLCNWFDATLLKKLFGVLLILAGTKELFYRERKAR